MGRAQPLFEIVWGDHLAGDSDDRVLCALLAHLDEVIPAPIAARIYVRQGRAGDPHSSATVSYGRMFAGRKIALIGMIGTVVWYVCVLVFWAFQSLTDTVPVGIDFTLPAPTTVSVAVDCNGLFDSAPRSDSPLPALKAQPEGKPKLAFQREPCDIVHDHAQIVFILDTAFFAAVVGCYVWLTLDRRRVFAASRQLDADPSIAGSLVG